MVIKGTVQGEAARKFPEFRYSKAVMETVTPQSVDPDRVNWMHEYPRFCPKPHQPPGRVVDLADYVVSIGRADNLGVSYVEVWMVPKGDLTQSREPLRVHHIYVADEQVRRETIVDEVLRQAFRP